MGEVHPRTSEGHPYPALAVTDGWPGTGGLSLTLAFPLHLDLLLYFVVLLIPFSTTPEELGA